MNATAILISMLGDMNFSTLVIVFLSLVVSITIHEAMHAFTAHWLGDDTADREGRISLNPLRHIDPFATVLLPLITLVLFKVPLLAAKPVPFNPNRVRFGEYGAAMVGMAGPLTNALLALLGAGFVHIFYGVLSSGVVEAVVIFIQINIGLFVFNMIPIPPLDGSRLLYAFAPESVQSFMAQLEQFGIVIVFGLIVAFPGFINIIININQAILRLLF